MILTENGANFVYPTTRVLLYINRHHNIMCLLFSYRLRNKSLNHISLKSIALPNNNVFYAFQ